MPFAKFIDIDKNNISEPPLLLKQLRQGGCRKPLRILPRPKTNQVKVLAIYLIDEKACLILLPRINQVNNAQ